MMRAAARTPDETGRIKTGGQKASFRVLVTDILLAFDAAFHAEA